MHASPENEIIIVDYGVGPEVERLKIEIEGRNYNIERILFRFSKNPFLGNNIFRLLCFILLSRVLPVSIRKKAIFRSSMALRKMSNADVICSIAGGDSFSDIYGFRQFLYVIMPVLLGLALNKPVVLLPQTYGPFRGMIAKYIAKYILLNSMIVYSRDEEGLKVINGITKSKCDCAQFSYDMGFALEAYSPEPKLVRKIEEILQKGSVIGLNVSGLLCMSEYKGKNMFGLKSSYNQIIDGILEYFIVNKRLQVILIPHVIGGGGPEGESDDSACEQIIADARTRFGDRIHYLRGPFNPHTMKHLIGQCDFFLGSRMHACVGALSQCVPTIGLAYSGKFIGVLNSIGVGDIVIDLRSTSINGVLKKIDELFSRRKIIRKELQERMLPIHEAVMNFYSRKEFSQFTN